MNMAASSANTYDSLEAPDTYGKIFYRSYNFCALISDALIGENLYMTNMQILFMNCKKRLLFMPPSGRAYSSRTVRPSVCLFVS